MSTAITSTQAQETRFHTLTPSFFGIVRGEFLKISRQWLTWIMLALLFGGTLFAHLLTISTPNGKSTLSQNPLNFFYNEMEIGLSLFRIFGGILLLTLTAYLIGMEYQHGTIRIILARGVGRLQFLFAQVLTIAIFALVLLAVYMLFTILMICLVVSLISGNLNALSALTPAFWSNTWLYTLTVLISTGVTILLATCLSAIGRSLAIGMSLSLLWFPADNIGGAFMSLGYRLTHNDFWINVTAYFLGPNLNVMPAGILPAQVKAGSIGIGPPVKVDGPHTLWIALGYALVFAAVAIILTWKRDVKE